MNPRVRRLTVENEALREEFMGHPHIAVLPIGWHPADQYRVTYQLPGVALDAARQPAVVEHHVALVTLGESYPRAQPLAVMETPIFHPNVGPNVGDEVWVGDDWSAKQTITDTIFKIGSMIQYQAYNVHSPRNAIAARWVAENETIFPIGRIALSRSEPRFAATPSDADAGSPTYQGETR